MTFMEAVSQFLAYKFPFWGVCHLSFVPETRTIYVHCQTPGRRAAILKDAKAIADLDIGVDKFIVIHPGYSYIIIPHIPPRRH
ncbi:hypothetical protein ACF3DV_03035 [Chlorogloeopsis fritschii PCC 9212]|uniref:Uncharacterized protein n=1 Tax=Chlorogloeopsis fritschii PCC 6912 TaxID=211165 RepID=A0A3S0ZKV2_CHLFR|nr:hypothetical protein [Chlorogloeopsis fritschii]MBF2007505.1 hypothetical protein [Chlorogloeopsis fritschii C42_A2020_084]RUR74818.1 hypothetical protein PCC6912_49960 [Chlorogloeopsis fritschii PCC 6912]